MSDYPVYPCVGCGYCCRKAQCGWSVFQHGFVDPCPELYPVGSQWRCKAANNPELAEAVGIGAGCCSPMNSDRGAATVSLTQVMADVNLESDRSNQAGG